MTGVYKITCIKTGKAYIGQSTNIEARWKWHISHLKRGNHDNKYLQFAWNKYGCDNFSFSVIEECEMDFDTLNNAEIFWIEKYNALNRDFGFNLSSGGGNGYSLSGMSQEERSSVYAKIAETRRTKYSGENSPNYGKKMSDEQKEKISKKLSGEGNFFYGKKRPDHAKKMRGSKNPRALRIVCTTTNVIFNCAKDAEEYAGTTNSNILKCCRGTQKHAGKRNGKMLAWEYWKGGEHK